MLFLVKVTWNLSDVTQTSQRKYTLTDWSRLFAGEQILILKPEPLSTLHLTCYKKWNSDDFGGIIPSMRHVTPAHHTAVFPLHADCLYIVTCLKKGCGSFLRHFATEASEAIKAQHLSSCFQVGWEGRGGGKRGISAVLTQQKVKVRSKYAAWSVTAAAEGNWVHSFNYCSSTCLKIYWISTSATIFNYYLKLQNAHDEEPSAKPLPPHYAEVRQGRQPSSLMNNLTSPPLSCLCPELLWLANYMAANPDWLFDQ